MYEVYAPNRPGRPKWAILTAAALFLLVLALAWLLVRQHRSAREIPLGDSKVYPEGILRARLPVGWKEIPQADWPVGVVAGVQAPAEEGRPNLRLFIFRGRPAWLGVPSIEGQQAVLAVIHSVTGGVPFNIELQHMGAVGPLPGSGLASSPNVQASASLGVAPVFCFGRAGVGPSGQIVGVLLSSDVPITSGAATFLDEVARHVCLTNLNFSDDARELMKEAGITFDPVSEVRWRDGVQFSESHLQLASRENATPWYLDVFRVPLFEGRTPAGIVADFALSALQVPTLPQPVRTVEFEGRQGAQITLSTIEREASGISVNCVQTDDETALIMFGRYEREAESEFSFVCRHIAETAEVRSSLGTATPGQALAGGRSWLKRVRQDGLTSLLGDLAGYRWVYGIRSPGLNLGRQTRQCEREARQDGGWWRISSRTEFRMDWAPKRDLIEEWLVSEDALRHSARYRYEVNGRIRTEYTEQRLEDGDHVERTTATAGTGGGMRFKSQTSADEMFTCEPVMLHLAARIAKENQAVPVAFSGTEVFLQERMHWVLMSMGKRVPPGGPWTEPAWAVRLQRDFDPTPITLFFDEADRMIAVSFEGGDWRELIQDEQEGSSW